MTHLTREGRQRAGERVAKAVVPAAGLGTRFLPATKATPKEMLPIVDKPAIQYVVEEAVTAGLADVLLITGRSKRSIEDHFDRAYELEEALRAKDDMKRLASVRESSELGAVHYVRQGEPRGLGHAVLCARQHVGGEPFAVLLGDDMIDTRDQLLTRMIDVRRRHGGSVVALMEVEPEQVSQYGCAAISATDDDDVVTVTDLVEKPVPGEAPSRWIIIGRYVCDPAVFDVLEKTPPGRGGEIQLTDALRVLARRGAGDGGPVHGVLFRGRRYDTGNKLDYLRTVVQFACDRPDLAEEFLPWLRQFVGARDGLAGSLDSPVSPGSAGPAVAEPAGVAPASDARDGSAGDGSGPDEAGREGTDAGTGTAVGTVERR